MPLTINKRDKLFLMGGGAFLGLFIILYLIVFPIIDSKKDQKRILAVKKGQYQEMLELKKKVDSLGGGRKSSAGTASGREKGFSLYSFMDSLAKATDIKIDYIKPSSTKKDGFKIDQVELKLLKVTMKKLVSYLYKIETSKNSVNVKKLSITKSGKNKKQIDTVIIVQARAL